MSGDRRTRTAGLAGRLGEPPHPSVTVTSNAVNDPPTHTLQPRHSHFLLRQTLQEKGGERRAQRMDGKNSWSTYWVPDAVLQAFHSRQPPPAAVRAGFYEARLGRENIKGRRKVNLRLGLCFQLSVKRLMKPPLLDLKRHLGEKRSGFEGQRSETEASRHPHCLCDIRQGAELL